ncbi:MAG TPA: extensin family protein [Lysobacter sp.]
MTPASFARTVAWLAPLLLVALAVWAVRSGRIEVPERWNPWAPLRIDAPPNLLTRFKLDRASDDRDACRAALAQADMRLVPLDDRSTGEHCGFDNAVRVERTSVAVGEPFSLSCRAALSLAMWERHVLQQAAQEQLGARVRRIEHLGSYACRNLYGEQGRRRSQHATADAIDIAAFVLDDGRKISVQADWSDADAQGDAATAGATPRARFLQALHDGACDYFDVVLGPDYNRSHADHFHFDRGAARVCR